MFQMQHQMFVVGMEWTDFISIHCDENNNITHCFIKRVYRSEAFITWMLERYQWVLNSLEAKKELDNVPRRHFNGQEPTAVMWDIMRYVKVTDVPMA